MSTMAMHKTLIDNIERGLELKGITQVQLAKLAGVHWTSISRVLNKRQDPSVTFCENVAKALRINPPERIFQKNCFEALSAVDAA
jgi:DNA-binding XRE family transcriptional regulator